MRATFVVLFRLEIVSISLDMNLKQNDTKYNLLGKYENTESIS